MSDVDVTIVVAEDSGAADTAGPLAELTLMVEDVQVTCTVSPKLDTSQDEGNNQSSGRNLNYTT